MPRGPRYALVLAARSELLALGDEMLAGEVFLTGSVMRGDERETGESAEKPEASDIDFYTPGFSLGCDGDLDARDRADALVRDFRARLRPYGVDIRPLPGWLLEEPALSGFKRDATSLAALT